MKTLRTSINQPLLRWRITTNGSKRRSSTLSFSWQECLPTDSLSARLQFRIGRIASTIRHSLKSLHLSLSRRHLVGFGFLVAGLIASVLHQVLFTETDYNHAVCRVLHFSPAQCRVWCYQNWF